jgi:hypothetical protein
MCIASIKRERERERERVVRTSLPYQKLELKDSAGK